MQQISYWENDSRSVMQINFRHSWNANVHYSVQKNLSAGPILAQTHLPPSWNLFLISVSKLVSHRRRCLPRSLLHSGSFFVYSIAVCISRLSHAYYTLHPLHIPRYYHSNVRWRVNITKLLNYTILQFRVTSSLIQILFSQQFILKQPQSTYTLLLLFVTYLTTMSASQTI